ncbi:hypothetical protein ACLESD_02020 [Pyxidicoccus sp. 3LFB2]
MFPIVANSPSQGQQTLPRIAEVADAHFTVLSGSAGFTRFQNETILDIIEGQQGLSPVGDLRYLVADVDLSDANIRSYTGHPSILGYSIHDEPAAWALSHSAAEYQRVRALDPLHSTNVVNLLPTYAESHVFVVPRQPTVSQPSGGDGTWLNTTSVRLGQTFVTGSTQTSIKKIELNIDALQWSPQEALTLTLWDAARTTRLAMRTVTGTHSAGGIVTGSNNGFRPIFDLDAAVSPNTAYLWELTHSGGGDQSVGWVVRSTSDAYANGQAFVNGQPQPNDWYFQVYEGLPGETRQAQPCGGAGDWVSQANVMGQTFTVPWGTVHPLEYIELYVDTFRWFPGESLTLTIYPLGLGRPLASAVVSAPDSLGQRFYFHDLRLVAGVSYYMELTHNGAGDAYQGWVVQSAPGCGNPYPGGTGYLNRQPQAWDLSFRQVYGLDWYAEYVDTWLTKGSPSLLSYDHYPFLPAGVDRVDYFSNLAIIRDRANAHGVPFWSYIQSCGMRGQDNSQPHGLGSWMYRNPKAAELRWNIYTQLAYGAKGLEYFLYWGVNCNGTSCCDGATCFTRPIILEDGTRNPELYPAARSINSEVKALAPTLLSLTSRGVYHSGVLPLGARPVPDASPFHPTDAAQPLVLGHFHNPGGRQAVLVVNRDYRSARTVSFTVPSRPPSVQEVAKDTGAEVPFGNYNPAQGLLTVSLAAGDGRLFLLPAGY